MVETESSLFFEMAKSGEELTFVTSVSSASGEVIVASWNPMVELVLPGRHLE